MQERNDGHVVRRGEKEILDITNISMRLCFVFVSLVVPHPSFERAKEHAMIANLQPSLFVVLWYYHNSRACNVLLSVSGDTMCT